MALQANAVDLDAPRLNQLDDAERALVLGFAVLEVVVVVVELGGWVGFGGHAEGNGQVLLANDAEENVVAVCAVFVEGSTILSAGVYLCICVGGRTRSLRPSGCICPCNGP